jgi:hypothetical protein
VRAVFEVFASVLDSLRDNIPFITRELADLCLLYDKPSKRQANEGLTDSNEDPKHWDCMDK